MGVLGGSVVVGAGWMVVLRVELILSVVIASVEIEGSSDWPEIQRKICKSRKSSTLAAMLFEESRKSIRRQMLITIIFYKGNKNNILLSNWVIYITEELFDIFSTLIKPYYNLTYLQLRDKGASPFWTVEGGRCVDLNFFTIHKQWVDVFDLNWLKMSG